MTRVLLTLLAAGAMLASAVGTPAAAAGSVADPIGAASVWQTSDSTPANPEAPPADDDTTDPDVTGSTPAALPSLEPAGIVEWRAIPGPEGISTRVPVPPPSA